MVEARRIELLSKGIATKVSPSAFCNLNFAHLTPTDRLLICYLDKFPSQASENWPSGIPLIDVLAQSMGGE